MRISKSCWKSVLLIYHIAFNKNRRLLTSDGSDTQVQEIVWIAKVFAHPLKRGIERYIHTVDNYFKRTCRAHDKIFLSNYGILLLPLFDRKKLALLRRSSTVNFLSFCSGEIRN